MSPSPPHRESIPPSSTFHSPAVPERTEAFSRLSLSTPLSLSLLLFHGLHKSWTNAPSVLMLSFKSLEVALLSAPRPARPGPPPLSLLRVMGKRKKPHSDQDERERERRRSRNFLRVFRPSSLPPSLPLSSCSSLSSSEGRGGRGGGGGRTDELGLWVELPVVW